MSFISSHQVMSNENIELYRKMYLIRLAEEKIRAHYHEDEMKTPVHLSIGQEAIVAGVVQALDASDQIFGTYRNHGLYLAKTGDTDRFYAELFGRASGEFGGRAGSMHLFAPQHGFMGSSAIVGTTIPLALGCAFVNQQRQNGKLCAVFFGDGALEEGVFWESLNFACLKKLPLLFVCEDNDLAIHAKRSERQGYKSIADIVSRFDCKVLQSASTDPEVISGLTRQGIAHIRGTGGPVFLHLQYYRYLEHVGIAEDFQAGYRSREEFEKWYARDPVNTQRRKLLETGMAESDISDMEKSITAKIEASIVSAQEAPFPAEDDLFGNLYA